MALSRELIALYKDLFRGRDDVYVIRWERDGKSCYRPAYNVDWSFYEAHKENGGQFADYSYKTYKWLTDSAIYSHLSGNNTLGIYPLLTNNTSFFIALDFDEGSWQEQIKRCHAFCLQYKIPAYIERSRSGNGGHLWIFFKDPIPATKSRAMLLTILVNLGLLSQFKIDSSYDRMFPNQDKLSGKGLGNLIALPLQGQSLLNGNSCFLDPTTFEPYSDQWQFLKGIKKLNITEFNKVFGEIQKSGSDLNHLNLVVRKNSSKLDIILGSKITINKPIINNRLISFLRSELNFNNTRYFINKSIGKSTFGIEKFVSLISDFDEKIEIPRGFLGKLLRFCKQEQITFYLKDKRYQSKEERFVSTIKLRPYQEDAITATDKKNFGIIQMPPGSGKTMVGVELISRKKQKTLILVHRVQILEQWLEKISNAFGIKRKDIGQIGKGKKKLGSITIAMIQSLNKAQTLDLCINRFGLIIVDECHHIPATTFNQVINNLNAYYVYGLTATPYRQGNDGKIINIYLGSIIYVLEQEEFLSYKRLRLNIEVKETCLKIPFSPDVDDFELLSNILIYDSKRNEQIVNDVINNLDKFNVILILTERTAHVEVLYHYLKQCAEVVTISGEDKVKERERKFKAINSGLYKVIISTGQFFGEGVDINLIECLFLVYPFSFKGKLVQYVGRVMRSKINPSIIDYHDDKIPSLSKMFKRRNRFYKRIEAQINNGLLLDFVKK